MKRTTTPAAMVGLAIGDALGMPFETLNETDKAIFFMLKAKCAVVAKDLGCQQGTCVFKYQKAKIKDQKNGTAGR